MRWLWRSRLSASDKAVAVRLIQHLQTMAAYQQLTMERYNDALAAAAGIGTPTDEGYARMQAPVSDPVAVVNHVIPALEEKIGILQSMESEHDAAGSLAVGATRQAYSDFTLALQVMLARAKLQHEGFTVWSREPSREVDVNSLDFAEREAMEKSIESLNHLVAKAGLSQEEWLDVDCEAFNRVRASVGLPPMSGSDFRSRFLGGLAGNPTRFFRD